MIRSLLRSRLVAFAGVSALGLCADYAIYTVLCASGVRAGVANLFSSATGVTLVFALSVRRIFEAEHRFLVGPFLLYAAYQALAISAASWAVDALTNALGGKYLIGKTLVLPATFTVNFLFMRWLSGQRRLDLGRRSSSAATTHAAGDLSGPS